MDESWMSPCWSGILLSLIISYALTKYHYVVVFPLV